MFSSLNPASPAAQADRHVIRAEVIGVNTCIAFGIVVEANAPVLELCRKLIAAGHDPATRLKAYRGNVLCLRVRSIGEAAQLEIDGKGCGFKCRVPVGTVPPVRFADKRAPLTS